MFNECFSCLNLFTRGISLNLYNSLISYVGNAYYSSLQLSHLVICSRSHSYLNVRIRACLVPKSTPPTTLLDILGTRVGLGQDL